MRPPRATVGTILTVRARRAIVKWPAMLMAVPRAQRSPSSVPPPKLPLNIVVMPTSVANIASQVRAGTDSHRNMRLEIAVNRGAALIITRMLATLVNMIEVTNKILLVAEMRPPH